MFLLRTALNDALSPEERREALNLALSTFSHNDTRLHDYEMSLGVDKILCLKLGYIVVTTSHSSSASSISADEISSICNCLLKTYQCSSESRNQSFRNIGSTELVPLLIQVWTTCILSLKQDEGRNDLEHRRKREHTLMSVTRVLRIFAKMDMAKSMLIRQNKGVWIEYALEFITFQVTTEKEVESSYPLPFSEILGLIKDLTFRSQHSDKDILLRLKRGALQQLLHSCVTDSSQFKKRDSMLTEWFTAVMWNLVLDKACCYQLLHHEGHGDFKLIKGLLRIVMLDCVDQATAARITKSKRNAVSALGNILADPGNHEILFSSSSNVDKEDHLSIIPTLIKLVENDSDSVVRRRAMRTIRCLANAAEESRTKNVKIDNRELPSFLIDTISRNVNVDDENDRDMQIQACSTVSLLLDTFELGDWPRLETAILQRIEITIDPKLTAAMCRCLVDCVKRSPWRRGPACFSEMFWTRLEKAVSISPESHGPISMLFLELAKLEAQSVSPVSSTKSSTLTSSVIVNTMTNLLSPSRIYSEREQPRDNVIDVLLLLLKNESNKRPLAENEGLLSALVNVCLVEQGTRKDLAKQTILELIPEL